MADRPVAAGRSSFDLIDRDRFLAALNPSPGGVYADLACGPGWYSLAIAGKVGPDGRVYAVDLWPDGLAALQEEMIRRHLTNIRPLLADITAPLPLADRSMDGCLLAAILHDLAVGDRRTVLDRAARLLKPDGLLAVVEFKKTVGGPGPPPHIRLAEQDVERLAAAAGFTRTALHDLGPSAYLMLLRNSLQPEMLQL